MRHLATIIAICGALALIAASCFINYSFWSSQGMSATEGYTFGAVSVALDILKSLLPLFVAWAVFERRWIYAGVGSIFFVLFLASGLLAAIGFAATNKGGVTDGRDRITSQHALVKAELAELAQRARRLSGIPSIATIEANLNALRQDRRWRTTKGCVDATLSKSRAFCTGYFDEKARLASAVEAKRIEVRRSELRPEITNLRAAGAGEAADPQATMLAGLLPKIDVGDAQRAVVLFFAFLVELGASFGLFLATGHSVLPRLIGRAKETVNDERTPVILEPVPEQEVIAAPRTRRRALGPMVKRIHDGREPLRFVLDERGRAFMAGN